MRYTFPAQKSVRGEAGWLNEMFQLCRFLQQIPFFSHILLGQISNICKLFIEFLHQKSSWKLVPAAAASHSTNCSIHIPQQKIMNESMVPLLRTRVMVSVCKDAPVCCRCHSGFASHWHRILASNRPSGPPQNGLDEGAFPSPPLPLCTFDSQSHTTIITITSPETVPAGSRGLG